MKIAQVNGTDKHQADLAARFQTLATPTVASPAPWPWFEFSQPARYPGRAIDLPAGQGGGEQVWKVDVAGEAVLFKVLRGQPPKPDAPRRPWLMLMHGMGLGIGTFRGVTPYLMATHDLILPDYGGFFSPGQPGGAPGGAGGGGAGESAGGEVSFKRFVESMWRIADAVGAQRMSLGGNSLGGGLSLMAAAEAAGAAGAAGGMGRAAGRIEKLLLSNPACYPQALPRSYRLTRVPLLGEFLMYIADPEKFVAGVEYIGYVDKARFDLELRARYLAALQVRGNRMRLMEMMRQLPAGPRDVTVAGHLGKLRDIRVPVMLTWGAQDPLLVPGSGERLAADLPNVVLDWHPDLAHMPHEEAPERVGPAWSKFLNAEKPATNKNS